ncbi:hypothetical protein KEJ32_03665 [Candidatus Bathyarchaeota archaeon]|nr:hypothetical protein [Candidatus Bathyarchaeota archaeon]
MVGRRVIYEVEEIRGNCPVYKLGDKIVIESQYPTECIRVKKSSDVCMRVLDNMWSHLLYQTGSDELISYMSGAVGEVRIACSMPGEPYTPCGYVIWRISREKL